MYSKQIAAACNGFKPLHFKYGSCTTISTGWHACGSPVEARYFRLTVDRQMAVRPISTWTPAVYEWEIQSRANLTTAEVRRASLVCQLGARYPSPLLRLLSRARRFLLLHSLGTWEGCLYLLP